MAPLDSILKLLASSESRHALVDNVPPGVRYVDETDPRWVAPDLTPVDRAELDPGATALVLISAPAAVGKSMLAGAIAQQTGAVLWDLAAFQVGSNFLSGTLSNTHGFAAAGDVARALSDGEFLIVMDALDEAAVKAGLANLEAFATDLAAVLGKLKPARPAVVILARAETAELAQLILDEEGLSVAHYSIAYFDQQQSEEFLDLRLDRRRLDQRDAPTHRTHREPFERARDSLFSKVFNVLGLDGATWDEPEARGFLGYAPVLEALAEYLDHPNYGVLAQEIEDSFGVDTDEAHAGIWRFLVAIVDRIMIREQGKLQGNLPEDLRGRLADAGKLDTVYAPVEQCRRLVGQALRLEHVDVDLDLPLELREGYEDAVRQILSEHPFLGARRGEFANAVFGDYLFARALAAGPDAERDAVRAHVAETTFRPSPLLARFMLELGQAVDGSTRIEIGDFPILYDSMRAEDAVDLSISLSLTEKDGDLIAQVVSPTAGHLELTMPIAEDKTVEIFRRLSNAQVVLDAVSVALGRMGEPFAIGPNTSVRAPAVIVRSPDLRVETRAGSDGGVLIATDRFICEAPDPQVGCYGSAKLELAVPHALAYPWASHRVAALPPTIDEDAAISNALADLAKLVTWFKSEGFGGLGMFVKPLDAAAAKGKVSQALLDYAINRGLITKQGKLYYLHPADFGLGLQLVKAKVASESVRSFLEGFLADSG